MKQQKERKRPPLDLSAWISPPLPKIMGILNVTRESFYDGGNYFTTDQAVEHALEMEKSGADIIDIGGESTKPGSDSVTLEEEKARVLPVIEKIRKTSSVPISIDTTKADVAWEAVRLGADIINDVSALRFDPHMKEVLISTGVPVILMHMKGIPKTMQKEIQYTDCLKEIRDFLMKQSEQLTSCGYDKKKIIIDPGIGFGKNLRHNLFILKNVDYFTKMGMPVLIGPSRKSFIGEIIQKEPEKRLSGTLGALVCAVRGGAALVRVHDVPETKDFFDVLNAINNVKKQPCPCENS